MTVAPIATPDAIATKVSCFIRGPPRCSWTTLIAQARQDDVVYLIRTRRAHVSLASGHLAWLVACLQSRASRAVRNQRLVMSLQMVQTDQGWRKEWKGQVLLALAFHNSVLCLHCKSPYTLSSEAGQVSTRSISASNSTRLLEILAQVAGDERLEAVTFYQLFLKGEEDFAASQGCEAC